MREAIDWVVRLRSGSATTDDSAAVQRWRRQSPAHEEAFRRAVRLWRDFKGIAERSPEENLAASGAPVPWLHRPVARRAIMGGAVAAAAAGYMVVRPPFGLWPSWQEMQADFRTAKGEQRQISLGNDVSVTLGTLTSVAVRSTPQQPLIELIAGEAAISADAPGSAPLVVIAGDGQIRASQANFNARCIDANVSVTCLSGSVEVEHAGQSSRLTPNQNVSYSPLGLGPSRTIDAAQVASWQSGLLVFHDQSLADVVDEINRYRPGRIVITSPELARKVVNATFHTNQLDNFFVQAQELFGAKVTRLPAGIALLS